MTFGAFDLPIYKSREWYALPLDDERRWRSMIRAADAWHAEGSPAAIRARLVEELAIIDAICRLRVRLASADVAAAGHDPDVMGVDAAGQTLTWGRRANLPSHAELARRRIYGDQQEVAS